MNVQDTLKTSMLLYPSIHPTKWEVYHHWFIVNGNGYEWINGELVSLEENKVPTLEEAIEKQFEFDLSDRQLLSSPKFSRDYCLNNIKTILNFEENCKIFEPKETRGYRIYPICEYAKILNIPQDVKPDWKEALQEMYEWLCINYNNFSESDKNFIDQIKL